MIIVRATIRAYLTLKSLRMDFLSRSGIFIVLISAVLAHRGSTMLETQSKNVYMLRLAASILIVISIWIALSHFPAAS